jgi:hypothetical protein
MIAGLQKVKERRSATFLPSLPAILQSGSILPTLNTGRRRLSARPSARPQ